MITQQLTISKSLLDFLVSFVIFRLSGKLESCTRIVPTHVGRKVLVNCFFSRCCHRDITEITSQQLGGPLVDSAGEPMPQQIGIPRLKCFLHGLFRYYRVVGHYQPLAILQRVQTGALLRHR
jgi:hypothetical protein